MHQTTIQEPVIHRRDLLRLTAALGAFTGLTSLGFGARAGGSGPPSPPASPHSPAAAALLPGLNDDSAYNWLTVLGMTQYRSADIGECFIAGRTLENGRPGDAVAVFMQLAGRIEKTARQSLAKGHSISARDAFLRASSYYFASTYFLDAANMAGQFKSIWERHRNCFDEAVALFVPPAEKVKIPFEGSSLPGYFIRVDTSGQPRPTLILNNGSDWSALNMWTSGGAAAIERGYNILIFDGPGQGAALWRQGLYFRPNWETVVTPVVDYLLTRTAVDPKRIAIQGISQGGYWVPRALAFEHRIAAGIADPGVYNLASNTLGELPPPMLELLKAGNKPTFDQYMAQGIKQSPEIRATLAFRMRPYGLQSYFDFFRTLEKYTLKGVVQNVRCPMLILNPVADQFFPGQASQVYQALRSPKTLVDFTAADGSDLHCEVQSLAVRDQRVFDWLDETLA